MISKEELLTTKDLEDIFKELVPQMRLLRDAQCEIAQLKKQLTEIDGGLVRHGVFLADMVHGW